MPLQDGSDNSRTGHTAQQQVRMEQLRLSIQQLMNGDASIEAKASLGLRVGRDGEPALFTEVELEAFGVKLLEAKEPETSDNAPQAKKLVNPHYRRQSPARDRGKSSRKSQGRGRLGGPFSFGP